MPNYKSSKQMETNSQFLKRKINDIGSIAYKNLVYPFVRMSMERKTGSIICKGSYLRGGCTLAGKDYICENTKLNNVHIGFSSMIGRDCNVSNTRIGSYSCIGNIQTYIGQHPVKGENLSIHPAFYSTAKQFGHTYVNEDSYNEAIWIDKDKQIQIDIGNDVWIGYGVAITEGVTIGDGAVIGAGSLVNKNIEPYAIYAGVPAKKIGMRFNEEHIAKLLELKWWDKDEEWIANNANNFKNPGAFMDSL